jgi:hypothetical protein
VAKDSAGNVMRVVSERYGEEIASVENIQVRLRPPDANKTASAKPGAIQIQVLARDTFRISR